MMTKNQIKFYQHLLVDDTIKQKQITNLLYIYHVVNYLQGGNPKD